MHIRKATSNDVSGIADCVSRAMKEDDLFSYLCPGRHQHPACFRSHFLHRAVKRLLNQNHGLVMVTDTTDEEPNQIEEIIGYAVMQRNSADEGTHQIPLYNRINLNLIWLEEQFEWYLHLDRCASRSRTIEFQTKVADGGPLAPYKENYDLVMLAVDPDFQRRGIGKQLLEACQAIVADDSSKLPLILVSSPKGNALYKKNGFTGVGNFHLGESCNGEAMVWYPPAV